MQHYMTPYEEKLSVQPLIWTASEAYTKKARLLSHINRFRKKLHQSHTFLGRQIVYQMWLEFYFGLTASKQSSCWVFQRLDQGCTTCDLR